MEESLEGLSSLILSLGPSPRSRLQEDGLSLQINELDRLLFADPPLETARGLPPRPSYDSLMERIKQTMEE